MDRPAPHHQRRRPLQRHVHGPDNTIRAVLTGVDDAHARKERQARNGAEHFQCEMMDPTGMETFTAGSEPYDGRERRANAPARTVSATMGVLIPICGLALAFLIQFGGSIWWGATVSADVRHLTEGVAHIETDRYTHVDAARDAILMEQKVNQVRTELNTAVVERNERLAALVARNMELARRIDLLEQRTHSGR
jgi:cell division protein FtsB